MTTAPTPVVEKPPVVDPTQHAAMNAKRDERRNVIFAAIYAAAAAKTQAGIPMPQPFATDEVAAYVPLAHRIAVPDVVGLAYTNAFRAMAIAPLSNQPIDNQFVMTPKGAGALTAAHAKARDLLLVDKAAKPAATASGSARA